MKKPEIRAEVEATLAALGWKSSQFKWNGCQVDIIIGQQFKSLRFPAGISKKALTWEMGRVVGWVEAISGEYSAQNPHAMPAVKVKRSPARKVAASAEAAASP